MVAAASSEKFKADCRQPSAVRFCYAFAGKQFNG
jgi:hypothetical protein